MPPFRTASGNWKAAPAALLLCAALASGWSTVSMPGLGDVRLLESYGDTLLAGTENGRIYRSENGGAAWKKTWAGLPSPIPASDMNAPITDFLVGDSVILAASNFILDFAQWDCWSPTCGNPAASGGVLRSRDGGRTWTHGRPAAVTSLAHLPGSGPPPSSPPRRASPKCRRRRSPRRTARCWPPRGRESEDSCSTGARDRRRPGRSSPGKRHTSPPGGAPSTRRTASRAPPRTAGRPWVGALPRAPREIWSSVTGGS